MDWLTPPLKKFHQNAQKELLKAVYSKEDDVTSLKGYLDKYGGKSDGLGNEIEYNSPEEFANSADGKCLYRCYPGGDTPYLLLTINPGNPSHFERKLHHAAGGEVNDIAGICRAYVVGWLIDTRVPDLLEELAGIATRGSLATYSDAESYFQKQAADELRSKLGDMEDPEKALSWIKENPEIGPSLDKGFLNDFTYDVAYNLESEDSRNKLKARERRLAKKLIEDRIRAVDPEVIIASGGLPWRGVHRCMEDIVPVGSDSHNTSRIQKNQNGNPGARGGVFECRIAGKRRTVLAVRHPNRMGTEDDYLKKIGKKAAKVVAF